MQAIDPSAKDGRHRAPGRERSLTEGSGGRAEAAGPGHTGGPGLRRP